jgi:quinol-cytochrome oxidoreductase complex cytochrome b subunit
LIIGLTIIIALPFIASSIIIPILVAIHKRKTKKPTQTKIKKHKGGK